MVGGVPEKQLCRKAVACAVSNTDQLLVSPFWENFIALSNPPAPHLRDGDSEKEFAKLSVDLL